MRALSQTTCCQLVVHLCHYYSRAKGGHLSRTITRVINIPGCLLVRGDYYSRMVTIQGWLLFKGGYYSRVVTIQGWLLFKDG